MLCFELEVQEICRHRISIFVLEESIMQRIREPASLATVKKFMLY